MFRFINRLVNKQELRAFTFMPAIGWREVPLEEVRHLFSKDLEKMRYDDRASYSHAVDGEEVFFAVVFYGNKNKKDVHYVADVLANARQRHYAARAAKRIAQA